MAVLNTAIRGAQIAAAVAGNGLEKDGSDNIQVDLDGATLKLGASGIALADLTDTYVLVGNGSNVATGVDMTGDVTISNAGVTAIGNTKVTDAMVNDDVATGLAGNGLAAAAGVMSVDINELGAAAVDVGADSIPFLDATDSSSKLESIADLATAMAGSGISATAGVLSADAVTDNIIESDISFEDESANCDGIEDEFTLTSTPVTNSLQVFLNGLLQQVGAGEDYTLAAKVVTFTTPPATGDILLIHYIINN